MIENERDESLSVTVTLTEGVDFSETYTLAPGERIVERSAFLAGPKAGTVSIDGEADQTIAWPERSCYRHGIALPPDDIKIGWVEPLEGPGDTQHDCYPGDATDVWINAADDAYTLTVTITDLCSETTFRDTVELDADEIEVIHEELINGGMYDITVDVEGGGSQTYEFYEACWGVSAVVEGGEVEMVQMMID